MRTCVLVGRRGLVNMISLKHGESTGGVPLQSGNYIDYLSANPRSALSTSYTSFAINAYLRTS